MALLYADASALVKLVRDERESAALRQYSDDADLITSALVLTEIPRAIRRASADDPRLPLGQLLRRAGELLEAVALLSARPHARDRTTAGVLPLAPGPGPFAQNRRLLLGDPA